MMTLVLTMTTLQAAASDTGTMSENSATGTMWGVSQKSALVTISMSTGIMTKETADNPSKLESQELSAIDVKNKRYYTMGASSTTGKCELYVWSLGPGHHITTVPLPFQPSMFVGLGQAILVDPAEGTIIVM